VQILSFNTVTSAAGFDGRLPGGMPKQPDPPPDAGQSKLLRRASNALAGAVRGVLGGAPAAAPPQSNNPSGRMDWSGQGRQR
jgi:hypothetical protein